MTCLTCAAVVAVENRVAAMASLLSGGSGLFLDGLDWLPWLVNLDEVRGLGRGDPLCNLFRSCMLLDKNSPR